MTTSHPKELTWINGQLARKCECRDCRPPGGFAVAVAAFCFGAMTVAILVAVLWERIR